MDRAAGFERIAEYATETIGYIIEIERYRSKVGGSENLTPLALRVTTIFRREDDAWRIVLRHADPITSARFPGGFLTLTLRILEHERSLGLQRARSAPDPLIQASWRRRCILRIPSSPSGSRRWPRRRCGDRAPRSAPRPRTRSGTFCDFERDAHGIFR